jgi:hypothetical protein
MVKPTMRKSSLGLRSFVYANNPQGQPAKCK